MTAKPSIPPQCTVKNNLQNYQNLLFLNLPSKQVNNGVGIKEKKIEEKNIQRS